MLRRTTVKMIYYKYINIYVCVRKRQVKKDRRRPFIVIMLKSLHCKSIENTRKSL